MRGKAILVRDLGGLDRDPARAAEVYLGWGCGWIMVVGAVGDRSVSNAEPAFYARLRRAGLPIWLLYMKPDPTQAAARATERLFAFAAEVGATGVCFNPEAEWQGRMDAAQAWAPSLARLAEQARVELAFTGYARPSFHQRFPWQPFVEVMPTGLPLTYDRSNRFDRSEFTLAAKDYHAAGFRRVIPWGSFWYNPDEGAQRNKTPDELRAHLALVPATPGIVFWNGGLASSEARAAVQVIADWQPKPVVPPVASALLGPLASPLFGG